MVLYLFYIAFFTLVASVITFISGFGLSTIMTSLLTFILPLSQIIIVVGIIHVAHSLWKLLLYRKHIHWKISFLFGIPAMIASYGGALLFAHANYSFLSRILGLLLILYALIIFIRPKLHIEPSNNTLVFGGLMTGFFAGIFGIRGAIRAAVLSSYNLKKEVYIATTGFISLFVDSIRLGIYWYSGLFMLLNPVLWWGLLLFVPLSFLGAVIGRLTVEYIPQDMFRSVVAVFILLAGVKLVFWPV